MKKLFYTILLISVSTILPSCSNDEATIILTGAAANFTINTRLEDAHLNSAGNMGAYLPPTTSAADYNQYKATVSGTNSLRVYKRILLAGQAYGVGGILIINRGTSSTSLDFGVYDLACPYEDNNNVRIIPDDNYRAKCPKCKSEFELFTGKTISGPALKKAKTLQYYFVRKTEEDKYRITLY